MYIKQLVLFLLLIATTVTHTFSPDFDTVCIAMGTCMMGTSLLRRINDQWEKPYPSLLRSPLLRRTYYTTRAMHNFSYYSSVIVVPMLSSIVLYKQWNNLNRDQKFLLFANIIRSIDRLNLSYC